MNSKTSDRLNIRRTADHVLRGGAEFSACGRYRYVLWRRWAWPARARQVMFVCLNPSTADAGKDDATTRRCTRFAKDWGYSGLLMLNAYAYCATSVRVLQTAQEPIGPDNDKAFEDRRLQAELVVAAWGNHCSEQRGRESALDPVRPVA